MNIRSKLLLIGERKSTLRFAKGSFSASEIFFNNIKHLLLLSTKGVLTVL